MRRSVVRGRDGRGWRWRWRAPSTLGDLAGMLQLGDLADVPVVGVVFAALFLVLLVVVAAILVPFLAIGIAEALVLGVLVAAGVVAATLFGRPVLVRAVHEPPATGTEAPAADDGRILLWAVQGWGASRAVRDRVVEALGRGADPVAAAGPTARLVVSR